MDKDPRGVTPLECAVLRGGTSRGVFFHAAELDYPRPVVEQILLNVFGSPDKRQIDGLGGATSVTSKAAIVGPSSRSDADVDYTFAQVGIDAAVVDWGGNCGNISSAVGPYCINHGLVPVTDGITTVRIHNTNTGKLINARVPVIGGRAAAVGDCTIPGVPGSGARIMLEFVEPAGSVTGTLLPTGKVTDSLKLSNGRTVLVSVVDAANPLVFMRAEEIGLTGTELPHQLQSRPEAMDTLEEVRGLVAAQLGVVQRADRATVDSPGLPKVGFVTGPASFVSSGGDVVDESDMDVTGRLMTMQTPHESYMAAGAIATAAAALIPGTVVHQVCRPLTAEDGRTSVRIGHPYGVMHTDVRVDVSGPTLELRGVAIERTAREIMSGSVFVANSVFEA